MAVWVGSCFGGSKLDPLEFTGGTDVLVFGAEAAPDVTLSPEPELLRMR